MQTTVITFHAEKLHDEVIWRRVEKIASWMAGKGIQATFFVYPFRAQVIGKEVSGPVRTLKSLGHEIGQHTHFYQGTEVDKPFKRNDLSDANVEHCLLRDYNTLNQFSCSPRGFAAGGWQVTEKVWDVLLRLGFIYDCSSRGLSSKWKSPHSSCEHWFSSPQFYPSVSERKPEMMLCIPSTCSLGEWFKWGYRNWVEYGPCKTYQLVYLHDYDLLSWRNYLLFHCFVLLKRGSDIRPALALGRDLLEATGSQ